MKQIISLCDFSNFEVGNCNDSGKYGFKTIFRALPSGDYEVYYRTTSYFDYCDKCGGWHNSNTCSQEREIISEQDLLRRIREFKNTFVNAEPTKYFIEIE